MRARVLFVTAGLLLGGLGAVRAHAFLDHAQPRVGSTVKAAPKELRLWFTDDLDPAGKPVATGKPAIDAKNAALLTLTLALSALPPGHYKVVWQATCGCGHVTKGDFSFVMKP